MRASTRGRKDQQMPPSDPSLVYAVVQLARDGMKRRAIARALHISRNTVRKIVLAHGEVRTAEHSALAPPRTSTRPSKLDPHRPRVDELLKTYRDITAQRVFEILIEEGFGGGYSIVKDLVREVRPHPAPKPSLQTPPREPGELAECDWSPYRVTFTNQSPVTVQAFG